LAPAESDLAQRAAQLTPQQHRVLALMAEGKPNKVIASETQITEPTVKSHVTEILRRLGVQSRNPGRDRRAEAGDGTAGPGADGELAKVCGAKSGLQNFPKTPP
jgi:DNA-binding CsgD family transcriptional regulator